ncbi:hypothetical protein CRG98_044827, partial [Punica granatum]
MAKGASPVRNRAPFHHGTQASVLEEKSRGSGLESRKTRLGRYGLRDPREGSRGRSGKTGSARLLRPRHGARLGSLVIFSFSWVGWSPEYQVVFRRFWPVSALARGWTELGCGLECSPNALGCSGITVISVFRECAPKIYREAFATAGTSLGEPCRVPNGRLKLVPWSRWPWVPVGPFQGAVCLSVERAPGALSEKASVRDRGAPAHEVCPGNASGRVIDVGPCSFSITFQVLDIPNAFSLLLGRPWIHSVGAIPSSLHQKLKFIIEERIITVKGEEDYAIYKGTAVPYISVGNDKNLPFHSFETISVIRDYGEVGPSRTDRMIGKVLLRHNYIPGTGLGISGKRRKAVNKRGSKQTGLSPNPLDVPSGVAKMCAPEFYLVGARMREAYATRLGSVHLPGDARRTQVRRSRHLLFMTRRSGPLSRPGLG